MAHERMPVVMKSELQGNTTRDKSNEAIGVDKELGIAILFVSASPPLSPRVDMRERRFMIVRVSFRAPSSGLHGNLPFSE